MVQADVLIQAGHEGRTSGATGADGPLGGEQEWTPIVADEATRILREAGVKVIREDAFLGGKYDVKVAVFVHFDASSPSCNSGASIGYDDRTDQDAAKAWKELYSQYWPFKWMPDNFTSNLRNYYGFKYTRTSDAELVLEFGELTCLEQAEWLKPRLKWLGALLAHFLSQRINKGNIADPGPFGVGSEPHSDPSNWSQFYAGLQQEGYTIPSRGLENPTLRRKLGKIKEPFGELVEFKGQKFVRGKVAWFAGKKDQLIADDETATLTGEVLRLLPNDDYYCAMRWNYQAGMEFWKNRHLLVVNPKNNQAVVVRIIDWGPNTETERIMDLSPQALESLDAKTDDVLLCAFSNTNPTSQVLGFIS
ncbi:hypothetical protein [Lyngbya sp. PCC 8106]|uniref:hypothetical protein n=1 Tax=Lyngbya sp. (strain PCC 8106) TaxID=313612 RepID=UPI0000EACB03|nr:hypothetical protein [Lyngbya sp. PCC 8106]EAW34151.1 hypothetical protein L8106_00025 [Lyngbya sp. PCC 8106]